jgi:phage recombination protein Bet
MSRNRKIDRISPRAEKAPSKAFPQKPLPPVQSIVDRSVQRSGLSYDSFVRLIIQSALSRLSIWTQADLDRLLLLAERLGLDPLNNEIYATEVSPDSGKKARIVFVVGVDGWSKVINSHPQFDGMKFLESAPGEDELPLYFECTIFRKDRKVATSVREYMYEAHTGQGAWLTHPRRMLRHKAMVQCARICFGLSGIFEPDEAIRIESAHKSSGNSSNQVPLIKKQNSQHSTTSFVKNWIHEGSRGKSFQNITNTVT